MALCQFPTDWDAYDRDTRQFYPGEQVCLRKRREQEFGYGTYVSSEAPDARWSAEADRRGKPAGVYYHAVTPIAPMTEHDGFWADIGKIQTASPTAMKFVLEEKGLGPNAAKYFSQRGFGLSRKQRKRRQSRKRKHTLKRK